MLINNIYYFLKPSIPRRLQVNLRRIRFLFKRKLYTNNWPIDENARKKPDEWSGWPDQKKFALVLTHDVETAKGLDKCYELIKIEERLGFRSSFNFLSEEYKVVPELRHYIINSGFEVGLHGLTHDGRLFKSKKRFQKHAPRINYYLKEWQSVGFRSPSMHHRLDWLHNLNIEYDASTFDTDPFEPQPDGIRTIFPSFVQGNPFGKGYVELPYTLPQDHTLFIIMKERDIDIWKQKLDWIVKNGGMALLLTHPDYMNFKGTKLRYEEYPAEYYEKFLDYIKVKYKGQYWHVLPREIARYWTKNFTEQSIRLKA